MKMLLKLVLITSSILSISNAIADCGRTETSAALCIEGYCTGNSVYFLGYSYGPMKGVVKGIKGRRSLVVLLENNKIKSADYNNFAKASGSTEASTPCNNSFCVGDRVSRNGKMATVVGVKETARTTVFQFDDSGKIKATDYQNLLCMQ